jgi:hypothetical protein
LTNGKSNSGLIPNLFTRYKDARLGNFSRLWGDEERWTTWALYKT